MPAQSRTVRVFLSSTFRDFAEERDLLITKVFPELRRKCRERQVELVDVDLRWGITNKEAQQGKVLPICLAEIDRSRPYFMGFIGERYGWVPEKDQYDLSLILEQPWLDKHRGGKSVTELEMLHGVLNNPAMEDRAFFYFRDATYSLKKGGHYLSESPEDKAKLEALKDRIRKSRFPVVENYKNPEALAERVKDDLWKLIDEAYPESEAPDALTQERMRHEAYSATRRRLYLGGERYYETLNVAMKAKPFRSVLITGQSGGGKSALLSNWVSEWSKRNKKAAVIMHHLGSGADAADPVQMATRLMKEIARLTGDELKPESDPDKTLEKLPEWLAMASAWAQRSKKELLIVLDGLDKLSDRQHLRWFPAFLPPRVKLVASCLHGQILDAAKARLNWLELKVRPFTKTEQKAFIGKYLGRYRKSLTTKQTRTLQGHSLSGNPLFLLTVLEELRVFGVHEKLETRLGELLSPPPSKAPDEEPTVDDVFEHVLARIEEDLGRKPVQAAMEAIWASRAGLYQDELLGIAETAKLTPAKWAVIQNALDESLYESSGKINFGHDYLRKAVEDRYRLTGRRKRKAHRQLAEWFTMQEVDERTAFELPWLWRNAELIAELMNCLLNQKIFEECVSKDEYELLRYWLWTQKNIEHEYENVWNSWRYKSDLRAISCDHDDLYTAVDASILGCFLETAGYSGAFTENLYVLALTARERHLGSNHPDTLRSRSRLAALQGKKGNYTEAYLLHSRALEGSEIFLGPNHTDTLNYANNLGNALHDMGDLKGAEALYRRALERSEILLGPNHLDTLVYANNLGSELGYLDDYTGSEALIRRALEGSQKALGADHPTTLDYVSNLAGLFSDMCNYPGARALFSRALDGRIKSLGSHHPDTLHSFSSLGGVLLDMGDFTGAETHCRTALEISENYFGPEHLATLRYASKLGDVLCKKGDLTSAEVLYRRALEGTAHFIGQEHPTTLIYAGKLANLLGDLGNYSGAVLLYRRLLDDCDRRLGPNHSATLSVVHNLATTIHDIGDLDKAEPLYRRALEGSERLWGDNHASTLLTLNNLANLSRAKGDLDEAEALYRRSKVGYEILLGKDNPETLRCVANLGSLLFSQKKINEGLQFHRTVLEGWKCIYGANHIKTISHIEEFAETCFSIGEYEEGLSRLKEIANQEHSHVLYNRACFECKLGKIAEAKVSIGQFLNLHPEDKNRALADEDLAAIRDWILKLNEFITSGNNHHDTY